jgi:hypothetical protein
MPENRDSFNPDGIVGGYTQNDLQAPRPGTDEQEFLANLTELLDGAKERRAGRNAEWEYNKLALHGYTNIGRLRDSDTVLRVVYNTSLRKPPSTDNVMLPIHRAFVGKMLETLPSVAVEPPSSKPSERQEAQGLTALLDSIKREQKVRLKAVLGFHRVSYAGTFVFHVEWNPLAGEKIAACQPCGYIGEPEEAGQKCPVCLKQELIRVDEALQQEKDLQFQAGALGLPPEVVVGDPNNPPRPVEKNMPILELSVRGKVEVKLRRIQEVYIDPGASTLEEAQWFTIETPVAVQELRRAFPESLDYISADNGLHDDQYIGIGQDGRARLVTRDLKDHALLKVTYEKPSTLFDKGRVIYWLDGKVLEIRDYLEYDLFGRHSIFLFRADHFDDTDILGRPVIEDAYSIQDERNKQLRDMRAHRELTIHPKFITLKESGINQKTLDDTTAQVVLVNRQAAMMKPYWQPVPSMPSYTYDELERMREAIREKFGVTPHEMGLTNSGESGRYAAFLEAQSNSVWKAAIEENADEWMDLHRCILILAHHHMDDDQLWSYEAQGVLRQYNWRKIKLQPPYQVRLVELDALSKNPVVRAQQADNWLQVGLFNDPDTGMPNMRRYATAAGIDDLVVDTDPDVSQKRYARDLIEKVLQTGQLPQPKPWDHALVVSQEILSWLRDEAYSLEEIKEREVKLIQQLWFGYAQASIQQEQQLMAVKQGMKSAGVQPNPAFMQLPQGGGSGDTGGDAPKENAGISGADRTGEQMARPTENQEGSTV